MLFRSWWVFDGPGKVLLPSLLVTVVRFLFFQAKLLVDAKILDSIGSPTSNAEVLRAAAWLCGEFRQFLPSPLSTLQALFSPSIHRLQPQVQMVCLQAALKIYSGLVGGDEGVEKVKEVARKGFEAFAGSSELEVQQRVSFLKKAVT